MSKRGRKMAKERGRQIKKERVARYSVRWVESFVEFATRAAEINALP